LFRGEFVPFNPLKFLEEIVPKIWFEIKAREKGWGRNEIL